MRASRTRALQEREEQRKRAVVAARQQERLVRSTITSITGALGETEPRQIEIFARVVETCGIEMSNALLAETQRIEGAGGMMTVDGSRRRTPGGVYLYLLKQRLTAEGRKDDIKKIM